MSLLRLTDHDEKDHTLEPAINAVSERDIEAQFLVAERPGLEMRIYSGANWFFWIAVLSLINSLILLFNGNWSFLAGLGITQLIDALAAQLSGSVGSAAKVVAMLLNVSVLGAFVLFGLQARKRQNWAFIIGMVLYALDGLLFLYFQVWFSLAFHVFALYFIFKGLSANYKLLELERAAGITEQPAI